MPIERVTGDKLKVGDIIRNHGFRWVITAVRHDPKVVDGTTRYCVTADEALDPWQTERLPRAAVKDMGMGLRSDLTWAREVTE